MGTWPTELGHLIRLSTLFINMNNLSGTIPTEFGLLARLLVLWLNDNALMGTLPTELSNLTSLISLNLALNAFTGTLPTELGHLLDLSTLYYINMNKLNGTAPSELGDWQACRFCGFTKTPWHEPYQQSWADWRCWKNFMPRGTDLLLLVPYQWACPSWGTWQIFGFIKMIWLDLSMPRYVQMASNGKLCKVIVQLPMAKLRLSVDAVIFAALLMEQIVKGWCSTRLYSLYSRA